MGGLDIGCEPTRAQAQIQLPWHEFGWRTIGVGWFLQRGSSVFV
jgi:hypothetical protein